ncbi:MAG: RDD family protein [Bdellovibrionota bacterium]
MNTNELPRVQQTESVAAGTLIEPATLPGRAIGALIDYVVITSLFIVCSRLVADSDFLFLASFFSAGAYFTLSHSGRSKGQTIGKKPFGLRVVRTKGPGVLLSAGQAFARYFMYLGAVVLLTEIPPLLYRRYAVVADPEILDAHMLIVLGYFFANLLSLLCDRDGRALHDRLTGSVVVRAAEVPTRSELDRYLQQPRVLTPLPTLFRKPLFQCAAGAFLGAMMWYLGFSSIGELKELSAMRYQLENRFPYRIVSASSEENELEIQALLLDAAPDAPSTFARQTVEQLKSSGRFQEAQLDRVTFTFYLNPASKEQAEHPGTVRRQVSWNTLDVSEPPVE